MSEKKYDFALLLIGLDNAGKTTVLKSYQKPKTPVVITPTVGYSVELASIPPCQKPVAVYDCSGNGRHRDQWEVFFEYADAIAFVVDSTD
jgi:GTPase SAR1 family protein